MMEKVDTFESFIEELNEHNRNDKPLTANSFYIVDDAKQREKMTEEFYIAVKKEIAEYQERADYLIKSGSRSAAVLERWVMKIAALEEKKRHYEEILRRHAEGLSLSLPVLMAGLTEEEAAQLTRIIQAQDVPGSAKTALADCLRVIHAEAVKQSGDLGAIAELMKNKRS